MISIFPNSRFGFPGGVNVYRGFGASCSGTESNLNNCTQEGSVCAADSVQHAIAITCGGSGSTGGSLSFLCI